MKNFYEILGVNKDSAPGEIKKAYRKLVKLYHPDVSDNSHKSKKIKFEEISAAYNVLSKPAKRQAYDKSLSEKKNIISGINFKFMEFKKWLFSNKVINLVLQGKRLTPEDNNISQAASLLSVDELLKRVIYSSNVYVKICAVRAIFLKKKHYAVNDMIRVLYSGIEDSVKLEIIKGLANYHETRVKKVMKEFASIMPAR